MVRARNMPCLPTSGNCLEDKNIPAGEHTCNLSSQGEIKTEATKLCKDGYTQPKSLIKYQTITQVRTVTVCFPFVLYLSGGERLW